MKPSPFELAELFKSDRLTMQEFNSDPKNLWALLLGEIEEARVEVHKYTSSTEKDPNALFRELVDVILLASDMIYRLGGDTDQEMREKVARNILKYPVWLFSNGLSYQEASKIAKSEWKNGRKEDDFYDIPR